MTSATASYSIRLTVHRSQRTISAPAASLPGLTKDAVANCDAYIGTTLVSINATADTQMFTSFELYTTEDYSNSPDGYAIVTIPDYLKSGYYLINNAGLDEIL